MALNKTTNVPWQNQNNATAPVTTNFTAEAVVSGNTLTAGHKVYMPGVFTAGTPVEGTSTNNHQ